MLLLVLLGLLHRAAPVCQFQNPFYFVEVMMEIMIMIMMMIMIIYFVERPSVVTVVDSSGQMVADR